MGEFVRMGKWKRYGYIRCGPDECWTWVGAITPRGYGVCTVNRKPARAHRVVYERLVGPIPAGLQLDHLCRNTLCVNPNHLEPVTSRENTMRSNAPSAINARKTHCPRGHAFTPDNLEAYALKVRGRRNCKACHRIREIARQNRIREIARQNRAKDAA